ncbi:MAG TPA: DHA2 family efflux MFS transporter permease subunit [bacterium]|nr:DHA2 family efflux MFS transporter permease subunit [bacterium]
MAAVATAAGGDRLAHPGKWVVAASVLSGSMMASIDTSVVTVSLAHIQSAYGVTTHEVAWITTSYLITLVITMPLTAWVSSILGRKRMFLAAISIFTGASLMCGLSRTLGALITFRVLQGLGGGALQPTAQAIMRETFPVEEQGQAMAFYGMIVLLGPAVGPTLGGWITETLSWPWIFFVNIPVGIAGLLLGTQFIVDPPYMRGRGLRKLDGVGIGLMAIGLAAMQIVLEQGEQNGWFQSGFIVALSAVAVVALTAFILWELRVPEPAVNLRILRNVSFAAGTFIGGIVSLTRFGSLILLPLFLQNVLGYSPTRSGLTVMPRALTMVLAMPILGALYNSVGVYVMLTIGIVLSAVSCFEMAFFNLGSGSAQLLLPQFIQGLGSAFVFVSLTTTSLSTIPRAQMQSATGMNSLLRQLGSSFGTAIAITLVDHRTTTASVNLVRYASISNPIFMRWWTAYQTAFLHRGSDPTTAHWRALMALERLIAQQASVVGYGYAFGVLGWISLLCLPLVLFLRRGNAPDRNPASGG